MLIEIPKDFSGNATTLLDKQPKKLELIYTPNEGFNFLSAQIGGTAAEKIKTAVAEKVTETYAETMFKQVSKLADGVNQASDGAGRLSDGTLDLNKGSKDLKEGLAAFSKKSIVFNNGMKTADTGVNEVASGNKSLNAGLGQLLAGHIQLEAASSQLEEGGKELQKVSNKQKMEFKRLTGKCPRS
jgi:putative membrane protein